MSGGHISTWLPEKWPSLFRVILSTSSDHITARAVEDYKPYWLVLQYLDLDARTTIVNKFFDQYHKVISYY